LIRYCDGREGLWQRPRRSRVRNAHAFMLTRDTLCQGCLLGRCSDMHGHDSEPTLRAIVSQLNVELGILAWVLEEEIDIADQGGSAPYRHRQACSRSVGECSNGRATEYKFSKKKLNELSLKERWTRKFYVPSSSSCQLEHPIGISSRCR
jgi:hypothetical protein